MEAYYDFVTVAKCWHDTNLWEVGQAARFVANPLDVPKYFRAADPKVEEARLQLRSGAITREQALALLDGEKVEEPAPQAAPQSPRARGPRPRAVEPPTLDLTEGVE